jgi:hypothetical protein
LDHPLGLFRIEARWKMTYLEPPHLGNLSTDIDFTRDSSGDESGTVFFEPLEQYSLSLSIYLLSAPLTIPLVCCHIKSFRRASSCGGTMARRRKEERRAGIASRGI